MTDNEIIKAFEHLVKNAGNHIPITGKMLLEDVLGVLNRQKAEIEKYKNIKTTMDEFWDILLRCKVANRKEKPTLEELADSIHQIEVNAIKEFTSRIERVLSLHPAQAKYYLEIKKEYIKENENENS